MEIAAPITSSRLAIFASVLQTLDKSNDLTTCLPQLLLLQILALLQVAYAIINVTARCNKMSRWPHWLQQLVAPPTRSTRPKTSLHAQTAEFAQPLWGRDNFDDVDESSDTVKCTVYNIGGELTQVLSLTCSKQLPMIPHVGVRLYGTEYFYSDVIESRPVAVMQDMLEDFPQVSFDLGPATVTEAELEEWIASDALQSQWQPESYNVFDHNCNHFARVICDKVTENGLEESLMRPVIAVTEEMSELPEWRKNWARAMNQITRLVVVSWGRATRAEEEALAAAEARGGGVRHEVSPFSDVRR